MNPRWLALALTTAIGCGNPVASGSYPGQSLFVVHGTVNGQVSAPPPVAPTVGIVWIGINGGVVAGDTAPIKATAFPAGFDLSVFAPPPDSAIATFWDPSKNDVGEIAYAILFAFDDVDHDGKFQFTAIQGDPHGALAAPDVVLGLASDDMLIYVKKKLVSDGVWSQEFGDLGTPLKISQVINNYQGVAAGFYIGEFTCSPDKSSLKIIDRASPVPITLVPPSAKFPKLPPTTCPPAKPTSFVDR